MTHGLLDVAFPPYCILCRRYVARIEYGLCDSCFASFDEERGRPSCPACGRTVSRHGVFDGCCRDCLTEHLKFTGITRVGEYRGKLGALIRAYKYHGRTRLEPLLSAWLTEAVAAAPWRSRVEAVVSVPTHWRHALGRPLYAADALADRVAKAAALPRARVLRRIRGGPHQIGLSFSERTDNVRGAFAMRRGVSLHGARLLLIDDVKTTGATLKECTKVLLAGGAAEVFAAVIVTVSTNDPAPSDRP